MSADPSWHNTPPPSLVSEPPLSPLPPSAEPAPLLSPPPAPEPPAPVSLTSYRVFLRLDTGDQLEVASHPDEASARAEATALMRYLRDGRGDWPFVGGRFVRPERIVSVDVESGLI